MSLNGDRFFVPGPHRSSRSSGMCYSVSRRVWTHVMLYMSSILAHDLPSTSAFFYAFVSVWWPSHLPGHRGSPRASAQPRVMFLTSEYCANKKQKKSLPVLRTLHYKTFWGLRMGPLGPHSILRTDLLCRPARNRTALCQKTSPRMSCLSPSGQRLECIHVPPSLNHMVPFCQTRRFSAAGAEKLVQN